jgi:hypothetical protein
MNASYSAIGFIMGLGVPELFLIILILAILAVPIALIVWLALRRTKVNDPSSVSPATRKKCPDCAELVLVEARVCKHCGYRFDREAAKNA